VECLLLAIVVGLFVSTSTASAWTWSASGARSWATSNWNNNIYNTSLGGWTTLSNSCTTFLCNAWHFGGNIPYDTSGSGNLDRWYVSSDSVSYYWSTSYTAASHMFNFFAHNEPWSSISYSWVGHWRCDTSPNYNTSLHYAYALYYDENFDGTFQHWDHSAIETVNNGTSTYDPSYTGTLCCQRNNNRLNVLYNMKDRVPLGTLSHYAVRSYYIH